MIYDRSEDEDDAPVSLYDRFLKGTSLGRIFAAASDSKKMGEEIRLMRSVLCALASAEESNHAHTVRAAAVFLRLVEVNEKINPSESQWERDMDAEAEAVLAWYAKHEGGEPSAEFGQPPTSPDGR